MQPTQVTITAFSGDLVSIQLSDGRAFELPRSVFPAEIQVGESLSLVAVRGMDLLNEILRDEEGEK